MTDNFRRFTTGRPIILKGQHRETPQESLDRLRLEVAELRVSRERLVREADADRRRIERDLHDGPQQHLVALAVNLQLARSLAEADPAAAKTLLDEMGRDVQQALEETGKLAQRIYPPLLEAGGLAAALRAAAVSLRVPTSIEVTVGASYPPRSRGSGVLLLFRRARERRRRGTGNDQGAGRGGSAGLRGRRQTVPAPRRLPPESLIRRLHDRVEALGGQLMVQSEGGHGTHVAGSLPFSR